MRTLFKSLVTAIAATGLIFGGLVAPAHAAGKAVTLVTNGSTLEGSSMAGFDSSSTLTLTLISTAGTLNWQDSGSGVSFISQTGTNSAGLAFQGTLSQLNDVFKDVTIQKPCAGTYKIYALASDNGIFQDPISGHLYAQSQSSASFADSLAAAQATPLVPGGTNTFGYMATITSPTENILVANIFGREDWIAASDAATEGDWKWIAGPETGTSFYSGRGDQGGSAVNGAYNNWSSNEPNDWGSGEDFAQITGNGSWNDLSEDVRNYPIEWGGMPGDDLSSYTGVKSNISVVVAGPSGAGTIADPLLIANATDLALVGGCSGSYFKQTADITLPSNWAGDQEFNGHYDGDGHTITYPAGIVAQHDNFGIWGSGQGSVSNLKIHGDIDTGNHYSVGLLFGYSNGSITNVEVSGSITISGADRWDIGGLVGSSGSNISDVKSTVDINSTDTNSGIGGVTGDYWGSMTRTSWSGTMNLQASSNTIYDVGGITGTTDCANVDHVVADGQINITGPAQEVGGVFGYFCGGVSDSRSSVNVIATEGDNVGGFTGRGNGGIYRSSATGNVSGASAVGGFSGWQSWADAQQIFARGNVTSASSGGSLIGSLEGGSLGEAYATGVVTAPTSRGAIGEINGVGVDRLHWVPETSTVPVDLGNLDSGEVPYTEADAKSLDYYNNDGWDIGSDFQDGYVWGICANFNDGYPYLVGTYTEDPCAATQALSPTPVIIGSGVEGAQLTGNPGTWDPGVTLTFAWLLDGQVIANVVDNIYTPVAGDVGKTVTFRVTSTKAGFRTLVKTSAGKVITAKPEVIVSPKSNDVTVGGFAGNSWWIPVGFISGIKAAVKSHSKATSVICIGIVAAGGSKAWQKTLGLKRAELACSTVKSFNKKLKTKVTWKVAAAGDKVQRGATLKFNK